MKPLVKMTGEEREGGREREREGGREGERGREREREKRGNTLSKTDATFC